MSSDNIPDGRVKSTAPSMHKSKVENTFNTKKPVAEKKNPDPSSATRSGKSYPIPSFFEYRAKPKEHDSL